MDARDSLVKIDALLVLTTSSVMRNSKQYWAENGQPWKDLGNTPPGVYDGDETGKADFAGCVAGGLGGAILGPFVALTGCIGGMITGSAAVLIHGWLE